MPNYRVVALLIAAMSSVSALSQSTLNSPVGQYADYVEDSGVWSGENDGYVAVYQHFVTVPGSAWLRLFFSELTLGGDSYVRVTSQLDGEVQQLNAADAAMWSNSTAYFNGDSLLLELVAAPGSVGNRIAMQRIELEQQVSTRGGAGQCGICGADDRTPINDNAACRLMSIGCSATVYTTNSCLVSAGHCIAANLVAQFNVPASLANCNTVNPPVADQFPITSTQQVNGGVGNDWAVLRTGTNSSGQSPFQRYGKLRRITPTPAANGNACEMNGYGVDTTCTRSQTQQHSSGAITAVLGSSYQFNADVRGGNSGSSLLKDGRIIAIVTHCQVNCPNHGTRTDLASFVAARNSLCPGCVADQDGNRVIELADLTFFLSGFGTAFPDVEFDPVRDLNGSNTVDLTDLALLLAAFGTNCP